MSIEMGVLEAAGGVAGLGAAWGVIWGMLKAHKASITEAVCEEAKDRVEEDKRIAHKASADATRLQAALHTHDQRITQIERNRIDDVERIVRVETNMTALKEGQTRIEHSLELARKDSADARAEIIESLRELRSVQPRA